MTEYEQGFKDAQAQAIAEIEQSANHYALENGRFADQSVIDAFHVTADIVSDLKPKRRS